MAQYMSRAFGLFEKHCLSIFGPLRSQARQFFDFSVEDLHGQDEQSRSSHVTYRGYRMSALVVDPESPSEEHPPTAAGEGSLAAIELPGHISMSRSCGEAAHGCIERRMQD